MPARPDHARLARLNLTAFPDNAVVAYCPTCDFQRLPIDSALGGDCPTCQTPLALVKVNADLRQLVMLTLDGMLPETREMFERSLMGVRSLGTVFQTVCEQEGLDWPEAVQLLACFCADTLRRLQQGLFVYDPLRADQPMWLFGEVLERTLHATHPTAEEN